MTLHIAIASLILGGLMSTEAEPPNPSKPRREVTAADVAKLPPPGSVVPASFDFTPDGKALSFLKSESTSLSRVLWRVDLNGGTPRVVARPPGSGDTEANLTEAEKLRRERQRLRETGITQVIRAKKADVSVIPLGGDLYLQRGDGPLERLTDTPSPEIDPKLTNDASKVAFVRDNELFAIDLKTRKETQLTRGSEEGLTHGLAEFIAQEEMDRSSGFWWSPDGRRLAYQETDERHIPLYSIAHQGNAKISVETHRYPFPGAANAKIRLGIVGSEGGETRWVNLSEPNSWAEEYLARVDWDSPESVLVQVLSRDQKLLRLYRVEAATGNKTLLLEEKADTWVNLHHDLRVVESTGEFVWASERTGFRHLELRGQDGKLIRVLTKGEWPVDAVATLVESKREVWFMAGRETPLESQLYRVSLDGGDVERVTQEAGVHRAAIAQDGEHFVDVASSLERPPVTTLRDRSGKVLKTLDDATSDARIDELKLRAPELVEFRNRDGILLYGAYYAPQSKNLGEKAPLVVIVYGGPHVQTVTNSWALTADQTAQFLTSRGFAVWKMDNRGAARRGHAFESALALHMGEVEVRDQVDGVRFVQGRWNDVDTTRVGITGGSYGGYMTLRALTEAGDVFQAGVSVAPVTDWDGYDTCYTERYMGTPSSNPNGYRDSSVLTQVAKLHGDLLLIHGMLDENVHFRHSARLTTALIGASKPFRFLPLPDERHSSRKEGDRKYVAEQIADFFEKTLGQAARKP